MKNKKKYKILKSIDFPKVNIVNIKKFKQIITDNK